MLSSSITPRGNDARLAEERARELVVARRAIEEDQLLLAELVHRDLAARGERMPGARDEHQLVLEERDALDVGMAERPDEADLHLLAQDELEHLLGVPGPHRELHVRIGRVEALEDRRQEVGADGGRRAEGELAGAAARRVARRARRPSATSPSVRCAYGRNARPASVSRMPRPRPDEAARRRARSRGS